MTDYDSPWKEALDQFFELFLAFFFPHVHRDIDWGRGYEMLDKEFQQVVREPELGRRLVDKLVKVWLKTGEERWVLIHVEVQTSEEADFARRMYVYNYRLFDRYDREVVSLAVLGDERASWRPSRFGYSLWGFRAGIEFPIVKLLDYAPRWQVLEADPNPFATFVLAHLKTQETRHDPDERRAEGAVGQGPLPTRVRRGGRPPAVPVHRLADGIAEALGGLFWQEIARYEEEKRMPFLTTPERIGIEKGLRQGYLAGIALGLELKFGPAGLQLLPEIRQIDDVDLLRAIHEAIRTASTPEELRKTWASR